VVDTIPPTAPGGLTAKVGKGRKVALSWSASTDNVGVVGYQLYRNGKLVATLTGTVYTDALGAKTRTATYDVVAFDAADNLSAASNAVTVSL
jgi:chitodextrinase